MCLCPVDFCCFWQVVPPVSYVSTGVVCGTLTKLLGISAGTTQVVKVCKYQKVHVAVDDEMFKSVKGN